MPRPVALLAALALACGSGKSAPPTAAPPPAPAGLTAAASLAAVSLAWTAAPGASGYSIQRSLAAGGPYAETRTSTATSATDPGLDAGTTYFYRVQAVNAAGAGASSNEASATTAPPAPAGLEATVTAGQVELSWAAARGATSYAVLRAAVEGGPWAQQALVTAPRAADAAAGPGLTSWYRVRALNAAGASPDSAAASATLPALPGAPQGLSATGGKRQVQLAWTAVAGAAGYTVVRGDAAHGPWSPIGSAEAPGYLDLTAQAGATYSYRVLARLAAGPGPASAEVVAQTIPPAPTGLKAVQVGATSLLLDWTPAPGATGYAFLRDEQPAAGPQQAGLSAGTRYTFRVAATNASGMSDPSDGLSVTTVPASPTAVTAVVSGGALTLAWPAVRGATGYDVLRSAAPGGPYDAASTNQPGLSYADAAVGDSFVVVARNESGASAASAEVSASHGTPAPAAPVLGAFAGNAQVQLSWPAVAGATGYQLFRSAAPGGYDFSAPLASPAGPPYSDAVPNGATRYYVLRAIGPGGAGPASAEVSATPVRELCVATDGPSVVAIDAAAAGETEVRRFFGANTRLLSPTAIAAGGGVVAAVQGDGGFVTVHAAAASGNAPPLGFITGSSPPGAVAIDAAAGELYVGRATAIDVHALATLAFKRSIATSAPVTALLLDGSHVFAGEANGAVQVFAPAGGAAQWTLSFAAAPSALAWDPARDELYVGSNDAPAAIQVLQRLDRTGQVVRAIAGELPAVTGLAFDPAAGELVAATGNRTLLTWPPGASAHTRRIDLGLGRALGGLALDGGKLWVALSTASAGQLEWIAPATPTGSPQSFGFIGAAGAPDAVWPQLIADDAVHGELWFASPFAAVPTAAAYARETGTLNPAPLRQWATAGNAVAVDAARGIVYISDNANHIYAVPRAATGGPVATLTLGPSESSSGLWYDAAHAELVVAVNDSLLGQSALDFHPAAGPARRLTGPATGLVSPFSVFVDDAHDLVYAANGDGSVVALPRAAAIANTPFSTRLQQAVPALSATGQILVDGDLLYVANARAPAFEISVYPYDANGPAAKVRSITVRGTGEGANGLAFCN